MRQAGTMIAQRVMQVMPGNGDERAEGGGGGVHYCIFCSPEHDIDILAPVHCLPVDLGQQRRQVGARGMEDAFSSDDDMTDI